MRLWRYEVMSSLLHPSSPVLTNISSPPHKCLLPPAQPPARNPALLSDMEKVKNRAVSAGTKFRLMGLVVDIAEEARGKRGGREGPSRENARHRGCKGARGEKARLQSGKRHGDVMRAIRNMEPAWTKVCERKCALTSRTVIQPTVGCARSPTSG